MQNFVTHWKSVLLFSVRFRLQSMSLRNQLTFKPNIVDYYTWNRWLLPWFWLTRSMLPWGWLNDSFTKDCNLAPSASSPCRGGGRNHKSIKNVNTQKYFSGARPGVFCFLLSGNIPSTEWIQNFRKSEGNHAPVGIVPEPQKTCRIQLFFVPSQKKN